MYSYIQTLYHFNLVAPKIFLDNSILLASTLCNNINAMGSLLLESDMVQKQCVNLEKNRAQLNGNR